MNTGNNQPPKKKKPSVTNPPVVGGAYNSNPPRQPHWYEQYTPWNDQWLGNTFRENPWLGAGLGGAMGSMFGPMGYGIGAGLGGRLAGGHNTNVNDMLHSKLTPWNDQWLYDATGGMMGSGNFLRAGVGSMMGGPMGGMIGGMGGPMGLAGMGLLGLLSGNLFGGGGGGGTVPTASPQSLPPRHLPPVGPRPATPRLYSGNR